MMLRFDAEKHEYWLGNVRLPSVSEIIAPAVDLSAIPASILERKRAIGTAAHLACQYLDDDGDVSDVHPSIEGYVNAWRLFKLQFETDFMAIEVPMHNQQFAGTSDRVCNIFGIVDIKTVAAMSPATALQTAAYAILWAKPGAPPIERLAVQLKPDGKYAVHSYKDPSDFTTFRALLNFYQWKKKRDKC